MILESPDYIIIGGGHELSWYDKSTYPVTFLVIDKMVVYTMNPRMTHGTMFQMVNSKADETKGNIVKDLAMADIKIINPSPLLKEPKELVELYKRFCDRFRNPAVAPTNIIAGRFWKVGNGYISFWEKRTLVLKHIGPVEQLINQLGFEPFKVEWEIISGTNKRLVTYDKFMGFRNSNTSKADEEQRAQEYALHTKAGMKRLVGAQNKKMHTRDIEARFLPPEK